uniref:Kinesin-like protein n=1 Tax=Gasterosteus aculeatus aculeatus TaxID=481459 RepID=G3PKW6_GASAC
MEKSLSRLLIELSVKISRSDGRVHMATVKSVDAVRSRVMVEWNERNICRGKELEMTELCALNPELLDHIKTFTNQTADPPAPAPEKKYEGRLRSSRIPGPTSPFIQAVTQAEESVASRMQTRQTCTFQAPAPVVAPVSTSESSRAILETVGPDLPSSSVLANSVLPNQQSKKNDAKLSQSQTSARKAAEENNEAERMPPPSTAKGRRKSVAPQELNKGSKRLSCFVKAPDLQAKRGKFGEALQPNLKFHDMIRDFRETLEITPITTSSDIEPHRITVCVRKRPLNKQEVIKKEIDVVSVPGRGAVLVHEPKQKVDLTKYLDNQVFHFDYSFNEATTNDLVYKFTAKPLVRSIFEGGMATCFAYGQTGSGKTHTMGGDFTGKQQNSAKGIYALAAQDVFTLLDQGRYANLDLSAHVSFFEIYNGKVYDLLNKKAKLRVLEDDRQVNLTAFPFLLSDCLSRTSGQTSANANSSRSHAILQIVLRRNDRAATLHGKFSLVDLAGNERGTDVSSNDRSTLVETAEINRSLLALKECIRSLGMNSDHIPFRQCTLTKVLRDSFIGEKSRTCMIAMVSPGMASCEYTMNTLRYESVEDPTEPISLVGELQEKVYSQFQTRGDAGVWLCRSLCLCGLLFLQRASELFNAMGQTSYSIEAALPDLVDHANHLLGLYKPQYFDRVLFFLFFCP